jgi:hypothetical protein
VLITGIIMLRLVLHRVLFCCPFLALLLAASTTFGEVRFQPLAPNVMALINGNPLSRQAVEALTGVVGQQDANIKVNQLLEGIIENRLLAAHLQQQVMRTGFGPMAGRAAPDSVIEHDHDLDLFAKVWREYQQILTSLAQVNQRDVVQALDGKLTYDEGKLTQLLALAPVKPASSDATPQAQGSATATAPVEIDMAREELTRDQIAAAKTFTLARYRTTDAWAEVSLWDAYRSQNVHQRTALRRAQTGAIERAIHQVVGVRLQEQQLQMRKGWAAQDFAQLQRIITDKHLKQRFLLESGAVEDLHHDSPLLKRIISSVSDVDIDQYYEQHKNDYRQIESIRARHLTVATQQEADAVYQKIKQGMSFAEAVKTFSIAPSKDLPIPGDLGVVRRTDPELSFVKKLALIQPQGRVSTPYRMLDGKSFELIWVDQRESSVLPKDDKSLRFQIATFIARERAVQYYDNLRQRVLREADLRINSTLVSGTVFGVNHE